jgi:hypothetical protein
MTDKPKLQIGPDSKKSSWDGIYIGRMPEKRLERVLKGLRANHEVLGLPENFEIQIDAFCLPDRVIIVKDGVAVQLIWLED